MRGRVKDPEHLIDKIIRKKKLDPNSALQYSLTTYKKEVTDLVGIRALHLFKEDWFLLDRHIRSRWHVNMRPDSLPKAYVRMGDPDPTTLDYKRWGLETTDHPRGYRSVHYVVKEDNDWVEIQLRTLLEESWSEIDHRMQYPHNGSRSGAQYFFIFNRLIGAADEMGWFIQRYWNALNSRQDEDLQEEALVSALLPREIARLSKILATEQSTVEQAIGLRRGADGKTNDDDKSYLNWKDARSKAEEDTEFTRRMANSLMGTTETGRSLGNILYAGAAARWRLACSPPQMV